MIDVYQTEKDDTAVGMVIAAGIIMSCWGSEVEAEEIINAAGLTTVRKMRAAGVDWYDIRLCVRPLRNISRKIRGMGIYPTARSEPRAAANPESNHE